MPAPRLPLSAISPAVAAPLVSIVVLNYNYARFLPRSIGSGLAQGYPNTELIVVDDASTDDSVALVRRDFADAVRLVMQPENQGQGAAINAGFKAARGEVVIFLDADDHLYPHAVARVMATWAPWVAIVQYRLNLVDPAGKVIDLHPAPEVKFDSGNVVRLLLSTGRFEAAVTSGNAFSRRTLEAILPVPESDFRISADGYLVTVAPFTGSVISIDEPLGAYCQHGANAWAGQPATGAKFRAQLAHDEKRYRALTWRATALGFEVPPGLGERDHRHLASQVASRTLDPKLHPTPSDSRLGLAWLGLKSAQRTRLPFARRALLSGWFAASGLLPQAWARPLISWYLDKPSRPPLVQKVVSAIRALCR